MVPASLTFSFMIDIPIVGAKSSVVVVLLNRSSIFLARQGQGNARVASHEISPDSRDLHGADRQKPHSENNDGYKDLYESPSLLPSQTEFPFHPVISTKGRAPVGIKHLSFHGYSPTFLVFTIVLNTFF
jgi:hypothetical protein